MIVSGFQKLTLLDYPSHIACLVFTPRCDLRCPFCHNSALVTAKEFPVIAESEVLNYLEKRADVLEGVVITGGEPTLQPDLPEFAAKAKALGYKVKLDTNGTSPEMLRKMLGGGLADYVAMDIKAAAENYPAAAGTDCRKLLPPILESIDILRSSPVPHEFRTTFVKGIHGISDVRGICGLIKGEKFYLQSYANSGGVIDPKGLSAFSDGELEEFLEAAKIYCPNAELRK